MLAKVDARISTGKCHHEEEERPWFASGREIKRKEQKETKGAKGVPGWETLPVQVIEPGDGMNGIRCKTGQGPGKIEIHFCQVDEQREQTPKGDARQQIIPVAIDRKEQHRAKQNSNHIAPAKQAEKRIEPIQKRRMNGIDSKEQFTPGKKDQAAGTGYHPDDKGDEEIPVVQDGGTKSRIQHVK